MKLTKDSLTKMIKEVIQEQMEEVGTKKSNDWMTIAKLMMVGEQKGIIEDVGRKNNAGIKRHEFATDDKFYVVISLEDLERLLGKETQ